MDLLLCDHTTLDFLGCCPAVWWDGVVGEEHQSGVAFLKSSPSPLTSCRTRALVLYPCFPPCRLCKESYFPELHFLACVVGMSE